ncbi:putative EaE proterin [Cylindrospermopsis phage Cr-LKS3]|nr:putative EaE proterin [Cylindrospermopsis phage Cr-LKS3]
MSAGGGKSVERFDCTSGGAQFCNGCYTMTPDSEGEYVRHEDYAKLEQQRAALVEALNSARAGLAQPYMSNPVQVGPVLTIIDTALKAAGVEL